MTSIQQRLSTGRGKFTTDYPELGTAPVNYEDSISPEFFADEREAVFKRNWLCVGRINRPTAQGLVFHPRPAGPAGLDRDRPRPR